MASTPGLLIPLAAMLLLLCSSQHPCYASRPLPPEAIKPQQLGVDPIAAIQPTFPSPENTQIPPPNSMLPNFPSFQQPIITSAPHRGSGGSSSSAGQVGGSTPIFPFPSMLYIPKFPPFPFIATMPSMPSMPSVPLPPLFKDSGSSASDEGQGQGSSPGN